jgi:hypothetical protein
MKRFILSLALVASALGAPQARAQSFPLPQPAADSGTTAMTGPSVVGTDGILYQATSVFSYSLKMFAASKSSTTSQLFAYDPTKKVADQNLKFTGWATALAIGDGNRLFLVVGKTLYLIPTPFPAQVPNGAVLDQVAIDVTEASGLSAAFAAASILKVDLGGSALAVKVKSAGGAEYLYIDTFEFQWMPFKMSSKVLILDSKDGSKVREVAVE